MAITLPVAMAAASVAMSAAGAYAAYQGNRNQAKMGVQSARLRQEQAASELQLVQLRAREQEGERLRRADLAKSAGIAGAAAAGWDWWASPTAQTFDAENDQQVMGDISSIRLLGAAGQRRYMLEGRGTKMLEDSWVQAGRNAWIAPTMSLLGSVRQNAGSIIDGFGMSAPAKPGAQERRREAFPLRPHSPTPMPPQSPQHSCTMQERAFCIDGAAERAKRPSSHHRAGSDRLIATAISIADAGAASRLPLTVPSPVSQHAAGFRRADAPEATTLPAHRQDDVAECRGPGDELACGRGAQAAFPCLQAARGDAQGIRDLCDRQAGGLPRPHQRSNPCPHLREADGHAVSCGQVGDRLPGQLCGEKIVRGGGLTREPTCFSPPPSCSA
ncbi:MAG: hypothetical protein K2X74_06825 [Acetobacteraceae bacterium]|nr:hypothetical protein [Acetobacteraceae bacterium]